MAHYQNQYSAQSGTDQYGNPIRQTDEYGNVVTETAQYYVDPLPCTDQYGNPVRRTGEYGVGHPTGRTGAGMYEGGGQQQHRDGMFHHDKPHTGSGGYTGAEQGVHHERKGIMEKIKEKLPGGHQ